SRGLAICGCRGRFRRSGRGISCDLLEVCAGFFPGRQGSDRKVAVVPRPMLCVVEAEHGPEWAFLGAEIGKAHSPWSAPFWLRAICTCHGLSWCSRHRLIAASISVVRYPDQTRVPVVTMGACWKPWWWNSVSTSSVMGAGVKGTPAFLNRSLVAKHPLQFGVS